MEPLFRILKLIGCIITGGALASDSYVMFLGFGNIRQSVVTYLPITEQPQANVCRVRRHIRDYLQVDQNYRITSPFEEIVH